jgi:hypothetical protein
MSLIAVVVNIPDFSCVSIIVAPSDKSISQVIFPGAIKVYKKDIIAYIISTVSMMRDI